MRSVVFFFALFDNLKSLSASGEEKKDPRKKAADHSSQFGIVNVLFAAADGDLETLQRYHLSDFDLNGADYDDRTPLRLRVINCQIIDVKFLFFFCLDNFQNLLFQISPPPKVTTTALNISSNTPKSMPTR